MAHRLAPEAETDLNELWFYVATASQGYRAFSLRGRQRHVHVIRQSTDYYRAIGLTGSLTPPNIALQPTAAGMVVSRRG